MKGREGGKMDQEEEDSLLISCVQCKGKLWFASKECCLTLLCSAYELTGLSRGGQQVQRCKEVFGKAINLLVELASLQVRTGGEEGMGEGGMEGVRREGLYGVPLSIDPNLHVCVGSSTVSIDLLCNSG